MIRGHCEAPKGPKDLARKTGKLQVRFGRLQNLGSGLWGMERDDYLAEIDRYSYGRAIGVPYEGTCVDLSRQPRLEGLNTLDRLLKHAPTLCRSAECIQFARAVPLRRVMRLLPSNVEM